MAKTENLLADISLPLLQAILLQVMEMVETREERRKSGKNLLPPVQVMKMIRNHGGGEEK